jgi:hypothetical protein
MQSWVLMPYSKPRFGGPRFGELIARPTGTARIQRESAGGANDGFRLTRGPALVRSATTGHSPSGQWREPYPPAMAVANVPVDEISDWASFHRVVAKSLRFPAYYGRNGNAFIDCLRDVARSSGTAYCREGSCARVPAWGPGRGNQPRRWTVRAA